MFENCLALEREYADLEQQMSDPALHADPAAARRVGKRHAQLRPVVAAYRQWLQLGEDEVAARELAAEDPEFAAEADASAAERERVAERLTLLLVPRDPMDDKDVILEVKAGEGGAGVRPVRRRPAADVPALRRTSRVADRDPGLRGVRPRRLQGRPGRGEGPRHRRAR